MSGKWLRKLFTRRLVVAYLIVLQLAFLLLFVIDRSTSAPMLRSIFGAVSVLVATYIVTKREKDAYKLTWVFLILLFPVFGGIFYLIFYLQSVRMMVRKRQDKLNLKSRNLLKGTVMRSGCNPSTDSSHSEKNAGTVMESGYNPSTDSGHSEKNAGTVIKSDCNPSTDSGHSEKNAGTVMKSGCNQSTDSVHSEKNAGTVMKSGCNPSTDSVHSEKNAGTVMTDCNPSTNHGHSEKKAGTVMKSGCNPSTDSVHSEKNVGTVMKSGCNPSTDSVHSEKNAGTVMKSGCNPSTDSSHGVENASAVVMDSDCDVNKSESYGEDAVDMPQVKYLSNYVGFPVFDRGSVIYYDCGEKYFEVLLCELEKAKRYIFLEYFIISEGKMWSGILEILKRKAAQGVKVRVIYDDMGCFFRVPQKYYEQLKEYGIEGVAFNKFRPVITVDQNNRDHRKIAVIDGKVAFTGGINIADEYINEIDRFGHWKDCGVSVHGKAAWSFTLMFLQMWDISKGIDEDYSLYLPEGFTADASASDVLSDVSGEGFDGLCDVRDGYIQPYADTPIDAENVCEHVYLQIINNAKRYVYINTPYLIIDRNMLSALRLAAKSGVDVRIVTPEVWDKRLVHMTTRSYYRELINSGVRIYEYSKGFLHSKTLVSDDTTASVGTANLDYRSLYLHFECGVWMYKCRAIKDIKEDFLSTLEVCKQITENDCKCSVITQLVQDFLRVFAPLM